MKINRTIKNNLCLGCGFCEALNPDSCTMKLNDEGFYTPFFYNPLTKSKDNILSKICPSIYIISDNKNTIWGNFLKIYQGWSTDPKIRYRASSGGMVTSLCLCLLENKIVDGILQVGKDFDSFIYNSLKVSITKEDIIENSQSRYAPAAIFNHIIEILNKDDKIYGLVGKPCDIVAIKNFIKLYPKFANRIKYFISIFCAGMPSYKATYKLLEKFPNKANPISIKYRGDGWPGEFKAIYNNDEVFTLNYNKSWGEVLGRMINKRCKVCPDGIGLMADIVVGDAWITKNGYPDFEDRPGISFVIARTEKGESLVQECEAMKYIEIESLDLNKISEMQPYQAERRLYVFWRLLPLQIKTCFLIRFKGLSIISNGLKCNLKKAYHTLKGSIKRLV